MWINGLNARRSAYTSEKIAHKITLISYVVPYLSRVASPPPRTEQVIVLEQASFPALAAASHRIIPYHMHDLPHGGRGKVFDERVLSDTGENGKENRVSFPWSRAQLGENEGYTSWRKIRSITQMISSQWARIREDLTSWWNEIASSARMDVKCLIWNSKWWFRIIFFRNNPRALRKWCHTPRSRNWIYSISGLFASPGAKARLLFLRWGIFHHHLRASKGKDHRYTFPEHDCAIIAEKTGNSLRAWDRLMGFMNLSAHLNETLDSE